MKWTRVAAFQARRPRSRQTSSGGGQNRNLQHLAVRILVPRVERGLRPAVIDGTATQKLPRGPGSDCKLLPQSLIFVSFRYSTLIYRVIRECSAGRHLLPLAVTVVEQPTVLSRTDHVNQCSKSFMQSGILVRAA